MGETEKLEGSKEPLSKVVYFIPTLPTHPLRGKSGLTVLVLQQKGLGLMPKDLIHQPLRVIREA